MILHCRDCQIKLKQKTSLKYVFSCIDFRVYKLNQSENYCKTIILQFYDIEVVKLRKNVVRIHISTIPILAPPK